MEPYINVLNDLQSAVNSWLLVNDVCGR